MQLTRRGLIGAALASMAVPAWAAKLPYWSSRDTGFAADGADVVAYWGLKKGAPKAVMGVNAHSTTWQGAKWRFANAQNLATFKANPQAYAPRFGGYCSLSVAHGGTSTGDRNAWYIHKGQLYLNGSKGARKKWKRKIPKYIRMAEANWPHVLSE